MTEKTSEPISQEEFQALLPSICSRDTAYNPGRWDDKNPLLGHCVPVSLAAQSLYGGKIFRAPLDNAPLFANQKFHFINVLPDGVRKDYTGPQYGENYPQNLIFEERTRNRIMRSDNVAFRFRLFSLRLAKAITKNPLFDDPIYRECFDQALRSPCQKMRFGAVMTRNGKIVAKACNEKIKELEHMCQPNCIRLGITSRTESMLGACAHAEEWVLKRARDKNINPRYCDIYVAGVNMNGLPWIKDEAVHTCLRCALQMNFAGLRSIRVPVVDRWEEISTSDALKTASRYALGKKKI